MNGKAQKPRHVTFAEIGLKTSGTYGYPDQVKSTIELLQNPMLAMCYDDTQLLAVLVYQLSALLQQQSQMIEILLSAKASIDGLRNDNKLAQTIVETARVKAAKAEEKAAVAREKANLSSPSNIKIVQAGRSLRRFEKRIKKKF